MFALAWSSTMPAILTNLGIVETSGTHNESLFEKVDHSLG